MVTSIGAGDSEKQAPLFFKALMWTVMKGIFTGRLVKNGLTTSRFTKNPRPDFPAFQFRFHDPNLHLLAHNTDKNNQEALFLDSDGIGKDLEYTIVRPGGVSFRHHFVRTKT